MFREDDLKWDEISRKKISDCVIFDYIQVKKRAFNKKVSTFTLLDAPDWVNIIAVVKDRFNVECFLMVKQFRHGSSKITLEFPAGIIEKNEMPKVAAEREFLEETGYSGKNFICIGDVNPNPAFMNNRVWTYLVEDPKIFSNNQNLDSDEILNVELVPVSEVVEKMGIGDYDNGIMIIALTQYLKFVSPSKYL